MTARPTDYPVLRPTDCALRHMHQGVWWWHRDGEGSADCVVDDFGDLVRIGTAWEANLDFWHSHRQFLEDSAWALLEHRAALERAQRDAETRAAETRALFFAQPVTAELTPAGDTEWGEAEIRIGRDERPFYVPHVRLYCGGQEPLILSHAQLAALLVAAEELCKPARRRRAAVEG